MPWWRVAYQMGVNDMASLTLFLLKREGYTMNVSKTDWLVRMSGTLDRSIRVGAAILALVLSQDVLSQASGQGIQVVSPSLYVDMEAPSSTGNFSDGGISQRLFPASDFESLPPGFQTITQLALRPTHEVSAPRTVTFGNATVRLATTTIIPPNLSFWFANNIPQDATVVIDGDVTVSTANIGPPNGPREFDYIFELETPFNYSSSDGNLIMDFRWTGWSGDENAIGADFVLEPSSAAQVLWRCCDPLATSAGYQFGGHVWQFTFVSEPVLEADFDQDGDVDGNDFLGWQRGFGATYDAEDLVDWEANYGALAPLSGTSATVPEPATGLVLLIGMAVALFRRCEVVSKLNSA